MLPPSNCALKHAWPRWAACTVNNSGRRRLRPPLITPSDCVFLPPPPLRSPSGVFALGVAASFFLSLVASPNPRSHCFSFFCLPTLCFFYLLCTALLSFAWLGFLWFALVRATTLHFALARVGLPCLALHSSSRVLLRFARTTPVLEAARYLPELLAALSCLGICALSTQRWTDDGRAQRQSSD